MKLLKIIVLLICSLSLFSCVSTGKYKEPQKSSVKSTLSGQWVLTSLSGMNYQGANSITLQFSGKNRVSGFSGCNRYFASSNKKANGSLNFDFIGTTRKLCRDQQARKFESSYLKSLRKVHTYELNGNQLMLKGNSVNLVFLK